MHHTYQNFLESINKKVRENTDIKMNNAKLKHDRKVRAANFEISDKVLINDSGQVSIRGHKFFKHSLAPMETLQNLI